MAGRAYTLATKPSNASRCTTLRCTGISMWLRCFVLEAQTQRLLT